MGFVLIAKCRNVIYCATYQIPSVVHSGAIKVVLPLPEGGLPSLQNPAASPEN